MRPYRSMARHFVIPSIQESREVVYEKRKDAAQKVFHEIRQRVTLKKDGSRCGTLFNFQLKLDGRKDIVIIQHPSYGRMRFESPVQLVAWCLQQYV